MSASNAFETLLWQHLLQNANIANIGDATGLRGSTTAGNLYISLHTADPGEAGTQATSEATYTGYARIPLVRSSSGWTVATNTFSNAAAVTFGNCTAGSSTITYFGIGTLVSGVGTLLFSGPLTSPTSLAVTPGVQPAFGIGALTGTMD